MLRDELKQKGYMTPAEYAKTHYLSTGAVYGMIKRGELDVYKACGRYFVRDKENNDEQ